MKKLSQTQIEAIKKAKERASDIKRIKEAYTKEETKICWNNNFGHIHRLKEEIKEMMQTMRETNFSSEDHANCLHSRLKSKNSELSALEQQNLLFSAAGLV